MSSASAGIKTAFLPRAVQGGETSVNSAEITGLDGITVVLLLCYSGIMEAWHHCGITIVLPGSVSSYWDAQFSRGMKIRKENPRLPTISGCQVKNCVSQSKGHSCAQSVRQSALKSVRSNVSKNNI